MAASAEAGCTVRRRRRWRRSPRPLLPPSAPLLLLATAVTLALAQDEVYTVEGLDKKWDFSGDSLAKVMRSATWQKVQSSYGLDSERSAGPLVPTSLDQHPYNERDDDYDDLASPPPPPRRGRHRRSGEDADTPSDPAAFQPESADRLADDMDPTRSGGEADGSSPTREAIARARHGEFGLNTEGMQKAGREALDIQPVASHRQQEEEIAERWRNRDGVSPQEDAAQQRLAGMLDMAPGGAKMFGADVADWLPPSAED